MDSAEERIQEAMSRYENSNEQIRFFVNRGDVFQIGVNHMEDLSLGELDVFCKRKGYQWAIVSEGMGVIIR